MLSHSLKAFASKPVLRNWDILEFLLPMGHGSMEDDGPAKNTFDRNLFIPFELNPTGVVGN